MNNKTKTIITIVLLIFLFPVGLLLTWFWVDWPRWVKWLISAPLLIALLGIVALFVLSTRSPNKALQQAEEKRQQVIMLSPDQKRLMDGQIKADVSMLQSALELYKFDYQKYPDALSQLSPKYINEIKVNPFTNQVYVYKVAQDGTYSIVTTLTDGSTYSQISP